jgi:PAS domain S-box-containing protein
MFNDHSAVMLVIDPNTGQIIKANQAAVQYYGYSLEKMLQMKIQQLNILSPAEVTKEMRSALHKQVNIFEFKHMLADEQVRDVEVHSAPITIENQILLFSIVRDITERKQAEAMLRESEERIRTIGDNLQGAQLYQLRVAPDGNAKFTYVSSKVGELHECKPEDVLKDASLLFKRVHPADADEWQKLTNTSLRELTSYNHTVRIVRKSGEIRWHQMISKPKKLDDGSVLFDGVELDVTEAKRAEEALRESLSRYDELVENVPVGVYVFWIRANGHLEFEYVSNRWCEIHQLKREDVLADATWANNKVHPDERDDFLLRNQESFQKRIPFSWEGRFVIGDGKLRWLRLESTPIVFDNGDIRWFGMTSDITDRKRAEVQLQKSEEQFRNLYDEAPVGYFEYDLQGNITRMNQRYLKMLGYTAEEMIGQPCWKFIVDESAREQILDKLRGVRPPAVGLERIYRRKDGTTFPVLFEDRVLLEEDCHIRGIRTAIQDITERKHAEDEREKLQAQLTQAQKMESVGRLAGGVAHDFNNMLGVIFGHTEMALDDADPAAPLYASLQAIQDAAERSAALTRQLLAFARKQTVAPKVIDINKTVAGMLNMLRRLIGEDIDLLWCPGEDLPSVKIDPAQIDQLLANLCVNARDAIEGVGKITIETDRKTFDAAYCADHIGFLPGEYLLLTVSDDGCGMDQVVLNQIFEPFFTTKEQGKGTGLGLASVFGMVKQNNGYINVYSEPGQGTTFKIYLPAFASKSAWVAEKEQELSTEHGHETVLLVEDEPAILKMTTMMLIRLGYTVVAAATPGEAIRLALEYRGQIDLLMTDVVMPEMNGRELAGNLLSHYPDLKRLFMSGYTADVIAHHGVLDEGVHFIQKPFSMKDLGGKLRETLEG